MISFTDKILKKKEKKRNRKRLIDTESKLMVARVKEGSLGGGGPNR